MLRILQPCYARPTVVVRASYGCGTRVLRLWYARPTIMIRTIHQQKNRG